MMKIVFLLIVLVLVLWLFPFAVIWAMNTLFNLGIAYNGNTWLAAVVLSFFFGASKVKVK